MDCAVHPNVAADATCTACQKPMCGACATFEIDGGAACDACGRVEEERSRSIGTALLALVGVGYLLTLALGIAVFKPRPFVGGLAAIVSIALGRALSIYVRPRSVTRRTSASRTA